MGGPPFPPFRPYWMHHCMPGTYPAPAKAIKLACKTSKGPDGTFQCYITQVRLVGRLHARPCSVRGSPRYCNAS